VKPGRDGRDRVVPRPRGSSAIIGTDMDGLVDIHAHVIPGVDDGPRSMEETLELARTAAAAGTATIAATPHLRSDFPNVHVEEIAVRTAQAGQAIADAGIPLHVVSGAETSLIWALEADDEAFRQATYGGLGKDMLVETPSDVSMLESLLYRVRLRGVRVTLAHPERSLAFQRTPERLSDLVGQGVLLQVNADSLLSRHRKQERRLAERLCRDGLASVLASDGHRGPGRRSVAVLAGGVEALTQLVGEERARWMASDVPGAIVAGAPRPREPALGGSRRRWLGRIARRR
jgi:protein-tyrosine phosphatase